MAANRVASSPELNPVRLHLGRLLILLIGVVGVIAALVIIVTSAA